MGKKSEKKIRYKFKFKDDYNPLYINGIYSGFNHFGEMVIHFYNERYPVPNEQIVTGANESKYVPEDFDETIIRTVQTGIVMQGSMAIVLRDWLDNMIKAKQFINNEPVVEDGD